MDNVIQVDSKFSAGTINVLISPALTGTSELMKQLIISDLKLGRVVTYWTTELSMQEVVQEFEPYNVTGLYYYLGSTSSIPEFINDTISEVNSEVNTEILHGISLVIANIPSDMLDDVIASIYGKVKKHKLIVYITVQQPRDGTIMDSIESNRQVDYLGVSESPDGIRSFQEVINKDPKYNYIRKHNA